jgi:CheY-like chemotaxis protein
MILIDLNLPVVSGIELLQQVRQEDPDAAVIVLCGAELKQGGEVVSFLDVEGLRSACLKLGAYALLQKPIS